jgi:hypothetical protein
VRPSGASVTRPARASEGPANGILVVAFWRLPLGYRPSGTPQELGREWSEDLIRPWENCVPERVPEALLQASRL